MGDSDLMEKILLQIQEDLQAVKANQMMMQSEVSTIKSELDCIRCEDEGRDLLGVIRVMQSHPKVSGLIALTTLLGTIMIGSTVLARFGLEQLMDEVEARYMTGPRTYNQPISPEDTLYEGQ